MRTLKENLSSRIVSSALELFSRLGYDGVSTIRIAEAAGVSQPSVHYHFKSKELLWRAAIDLLVEKVEAANPTRNEMLIAPDIEPLDALKDYFYSVHVLSVEVPELGSILSLEGLSGGPRLEWLVQAVFGESYDILLELIERCISAGKIKRHKPHHILMILTGACVTYYNLAPLVRSAFGGDPADRKEQLAFVNAFSDVVFSGLQTTPER